MRSRGDPVRLHVVGVAVTALGVVGHDDMRTQAVEDVDELLNGLVPGVDEGGVVAARFTRHAGVSPAAGTAEERRLINTERVQSLGQLADAIPTELVGVIYGEQRITFADDFAFFTESAGDDADISASSDVVGDGAPVGDGLVIRVRVHEQQPGLFRRLTPPTAHNVGRPVTVHEAKL